MPPYEGGDDHNDGPSHHKDFAQAIAYFKEPKRHLIIAKTTTSVLAWLKANKESYRPNGDLAPEPFFPEPKPTKDDILNEERGQQLRARAWEHGLQKFLGELVSQGVFVPIIKPKSEKAGAKAVDPRKVLIEVATDPMSSVLVRELVKGHKAGREHESVSLAFLMNLYGYASGKGPRFRDARIRPFAAFGLMNVRTDGADYAITLGPVGLAFYTDVYWPIVQHFSKKGGF